MKHNFTNVGKFEFKILNFAILLEYNKSSLIVKIVILCILETNYRFECNYIYFRNKYRF